jgi:hypothetical protein
MANQTGAGKSTKPTTRTTVTRSRKGGTTRTTTTRSSYRAGRGRAYAARRTSTGTVINNNTYVTKKGHGGAIAAIIIILILLAAAVYLLLNPVLTPAQQAAQFQNQLGALQTNLPSLTQYYINNAPSYGVSLSKSWAVEVTDEAPGSSTPIGQVTVSWNGQVDSLAIQSGIVNTGISPTYAVTLTPNEFYQFSEAVATENTAAAVGYYSTYWLAGKLPYTRVS